MYSYAICLWEIAARQKPYEEFNIQFFSALEEQIEKGLRYYSKRSSLRYQISIHFIFIFFFFSFYRPTVPPTLPLADEYFGSEAESGKPDNGHGQFPCPKEYAALIQDCWQATPQGRPSFLVSCKPSFPLEFRFSWALTLTNQCDFQTIIRRLHQQLSLRAWN